MEIVLTAQERHLFEAFEECVTDLEFVSAYSGSIFNVDCDAIVSPANSFGFMDGGLDASIVDRFGTEVQDRVRWEILTSHHGELLVGDATVVETGSARVPYIIAAPTMRVPMWLGSETINPYLATRAVVLLIREGRFPQHASEHGLKVSQRIKRVAIPGMGTGVGGVPPSIAARQMAQAIRRHRYERHSLPKSWAEASEDHQLLYTDKPVRLQR